MRVRTAHLSLIVGYLAVILVTLVALMWRPTPPARPFLVELSLALAFIGLVQIALQFVLIARFEMAPQIPCKLGGSARLS